MWLHNQSNQITSVNIHETSSWFYSTKMKKGIILGLFLFQAFCTAAAFSPAEQKEKKWFICMWYLRFRKAYALFKCTKLHSPFNLNLVNIWRGVLQKAWHPNLPPKTSKTHALHDKYFSMSNFAFHPVVQKLSLKSAVLTKLQPGTRYQPFTQNLQYCAQWQHPA